MVPGLAVLAAGSIGGLFLARSRRDAVAWTTVTLVLLFAIPASWVFGPLGKIGQPAVVAGALLPWWWALARVSGDSTLDRRPRLIRTMIAAHFLAFLASFALAFSRPLTQLETTASTRAVAYLIVLSGTAVILHDGIPDRVRLDTLLRRVVWGTAFLAGLGVLQFLTGHPLWGGINWPGLVLNDGLGTVGSRASLNRPFSTAQHPIEFGVVVGAMLPLALHYALHPSQVPGRTMRDNGPGQLQSVDAAWRRWLPVVLIGAAIPLSVSRSAVLSVAVALVIAASRWSWRQRLAVAAGGGALLTAMWAVVPGLIGTIINLFVNADADSSVIARTNRIPAVLELWREHPWLGRGFGTYTADDYFLLDNQMYKVLIESGVVGIAMWTVTVGVVCIAVLWATAKADTATRDLAAALAAGMAGLFISFATFDAFFYRILTGLLFVLFGAAGALARIVQDADRPGPGQDSTETGTPEGVERRRRADSNRS